MKVLVIGSTNHNGVTVAGWEDAEFPNVADFELVVIDTTSLTSLLESSWESASFERETKNRLLKLSANMRSIKKGLADLLYSEGKTIAICSPYLKIGGLINNYGWCPFSLNITNEKGDTINVIDEHFSYYFKHVRGWDFCFQGIGGISDFINNLYDDRPSISIKPHIRSIAENRYRKAIAAELSYDVYSYNKGDRYSRPGKNHIGSSSSIYCLPPPTQVSTTVVINHILKEEAHIEQITPPPKRIDEILLPEEGAIKQSVKERLAKINKLKAEISDFEKLMEEKTRFKQLLYETGTPLEDICKLTFRQFGCEIADSAEDFALQIGDKEAIVEVKGRDGVIPRKDGSQLATNRRNYVVEKGKGIREVKAILLGNPHRSQFPLKARATKEQFAPHLVKDSETEEMALVTTVELFNTYCAFLEGNITSEEIMNRLFSGIGVTTLIKE